MVRSDDIGKLILRLALGVLILLHGIAKVNKGTDGLSGIVNMLASHGLPAFIAYGVYLGEIVAPVLVIVGLFTRPAAFVIAVNMVVAVLLAHMGHLDQITANGGWALELQGMFFFSALALMFTGGGNLGFRGRFN